MLSCGCRLARFETYSLHPEATATVHHLEEILIRLAAEEVQAGDLEVTPEMAHVVFLAFHRFRVDFGKSAVAGLCAEDVFGERLLFVVFRVALGQVFGLDLLFWLGLDEHLPQTLRGEVVDALVGGGVAEDVGDCLLQLFHGNGETICLVVPGHVHERVVGNVAEVLDIGLNTPVPVVLLQKFVLVEEARVEAAHVVVGFHASVHDSLITLLRNALLGDSCICPFGETPVLRINLAKLNSRRGVVCNGLLESAVELLVVEEDVRVVEPAVEMALEALETVEDTR